MSWLSPETNALVLGKEPHKVLLVRKPTGHISMEKFKTQMGPKTGCWMDYIS